MTLLIIGKNGQVGKSLMTAAKTRQIEHLATDHQTLDITNQESVNLFFTQHPTIQCVINAAAYTQVDLAENNTKEAYLVNCTAVSYLAAACKKHNIPLIHLSTDYVFDGEKTTGYDETDKPNPQNSYGKTKLAGELILQKTWEKHIILRTSWVFSAIGHNFVKTIIRLCNEKNTLSVVCDQFGAPTSARSIAETVLCICNKIQTDHCFGLYHYSNYPVTSWYAFATYIVQLYTQKTGIKKEVIPIATAAYPTPAKRPTHSLLLNAKIERVFDIQPQSWMPEVANIIEELY